MKRFLQEIADEEYTEAELTVIKIGWAVGFMIFGLAEIARLFS